MMRQGKVQLPLMQTGCQGVTRVDSAPARGVRRVDGQQQQRRYPLCLEGRPWGQQCHTKFAQHAEHARRPTSAFQDEGVRWG
jgi:hypothetical protein